MADETGLNVGTITALYKIDRTQSVTQVGEIKQEAAEIRNIYGNITMKLDSSQVIAETRLMIQAGTQAKLAYAGAQQSLAAYRDAQVKVAEATAAARQWQVLANETVAGTRVVQQQAAVQTAINTNAIQAQRLATEQQRTANQQAVTLLNTERVATQQLATEKAQLALRTVELRNAMLEKNIALQDQTKGSNSASTAHGALSQSLIGGIVRGLEYAVAFRALYGAMGLVSTGFHDLIDGAVGWEQTLNELQNNTTITNSSMGALATTILQMGQTTSAPLNELAAGYRHATNEGFGLAASTEIVTEAQKSAVSTGANVATTTNLLASVMHEFASSNLTATQTMNVLHLAAAEGNLTLEQLVTSGGRAFATAASLGLALPEVAAGLSTLTREGYSASQSTTILSDIMLHIVSPSKQARDEILALSKATGIDLVYDFSQAGLAAKGISGVMADVEKATNGDANAMFKLIPGLRGGRGELVLTTQGAADFRNVLNELNDTMAGRTNPTQDAYNRTVETAAFQIGKLKNEVHILWIELGQYFLPIIKAVVSELGLLIQEIAQALGAPIPDLSGNLDKTTASANNTTTAVRATEAAVHDGTEGFSAHSQSIIDTSRSLDNFKQQSLDAGGAIRDLTENGNALKVTLDGIKESIASTNDFYKGQIDPIRAAIAQTNQLTPEQQARKLAELGLDQQAIQIKLDAPDTTAMDASILDLRQKIDDLGKADTAAIDTRIQTIQDKMQSLGRVATREIDQQIIDLRSALRSIGDTSEIDRRIEDLKRQIAGPAPDVSAQSSGQAALFEQQASGAITQAQFQAQYGALGRQKGQILDNYAAQQSAAKTQLQVLEEQEIVQKRTDEDAKKALNDRIATLEGQKAQISQDNAVQKDALQIELDGLQDQRKEITDTFNLKKAGLEHDLKQAELDRARAVLDTNTKLATITREQEHNKLLDDRDKIERDIINMPRQKQIDDLTAAQKAIIDPLTTSRDLIQQQVDKNNENLASMRAQKATADAQIAAAKDALKNPPTNTGEGPGAPTGPKIGGTPPLDAAAQRFLEENTTTLPSGTQNPLVKYADDIRDAFERLRGWFADNKEGLKKTIGDTFRDIVTQVQQSVSDFKQTANWIAAFIKLLTDFEQHNFGAIGDDLSALGAASIAGSGGGGGPGQPLPPGMAGPPTPSGSLVSNPNGLPGEARIQQNQAGILPMLQTNPFEPGGFFWGLLHPTDNTTVGTSSTTGMGNDFGDIAAKVVPVIGVVKDLWDAISGGSKVAAADLSNFDETQNTLLGPDGRLRVNITDTGTTVTGTWGPDGTIDKGLANVQSSTTNTFGANSPTQQAITNYGDAAGKVFGNSGLLHGYFNTDVPTSLGQLKTVVDQYFGQGVGTAVTPLSGYETFIRGIFGQSGGSINTLMTTDVPESYRAYLQTVLDRFGDTGDAKTPFTTYGEFIKALFQKGGSMDQYVQAFGPVVDAAMPSDIAPLAGFIKSVGDAIHTIGAIFKIKDMADFAVPTIAYSSSGKSGGNYAQGISNSPMPGHVAWVGERGPELMHVPQGSTIIPNHMLPGHADGLNLAAIQKFTLPGAFQPLADFIYNTEQSSMSALLAAHQGSASGRGRSSLRQLVPLIQKWADADGLPADIIGAIILHESGGEIGKHEIAAGGLGRGLMQVDGGTWPQAFDPRMSGTTMADADYQIEIGSMILQRGWNPNDITQSLRNYSGSRFDAVHGRSFYQELIDMGFISQADAALAGGALAGLGAGATGFIQPVNGPLTQGYGPTSFEAFHDGVDFGVPIGTVVVADANGVIFAAGDAGDGYGLKVGITSDEFDTWTGHMSDIFVGIGEQVAQGQEVGLSGNTGYSTGPHVHWGAHDNGASIDPFTLPGMANGGVVRSPTVLVAGDTRGGVPEIIAPQPMMKETVAAALKESGMGGPVTLVVEDGAVRVDSAGNVQSVDQSKFKIVNAMYARSMQPGR